MPVKTPSPIATVLAGLEGNSATVNRVAGKKQVLVTTIDLHQVAGTYDIATATAQGVIIESIILSPYVDVSDDVSGITGVTIQTDTTTEQELIDANLGQIANLTAEAQITRIVSVFVRVTDKIQFTIEGDAADDDPTTCDVIITYRAIANGGYLVA